MTLVWRPGFQFDVDASTYIEAVEVSDGQALETGVRYAINNFVIGCKQDGIWDAIKASCILAGARTLDGALVALVGTAPTKNGTEGDWSYDRKTGLDANGTDNYLDSNRSNSEEPDNNKHLAFFITGGAGGSDYLFGVGAFATGGSFYQTNTNKRGSLDTSVYFTSSEAEANNSLLGLRRTGSNYSEIYANKVSTSSVGLSQTQSGLNYFIYANNNSGTPNGFWGGRLSFYSIGESLDLAALDGRVTDLMTAIGAAIP